MSWQKWDQEHKKGGVASRPIALPSSGFNRPNEQKDSFLPASKVPDFHPQGRYSIYHVTYAEALPSILRLGVGTTKDYDPIKGTQSLDPTKGSSWTRDPHYSIGLRDEPVRLTVADKSSLGLKTSHVVAMLAGHQGPVVGTFEHEDYVHGIVPPHAITAIHVPRSVWDKWTSNLHNYKQWADNAEAESKVPGIPERKKMMLELRASSYRRDHQELEKMRSDPRIHVGLTVRTAHHVPGREDETKTI